MNRYLKTCACAALSAVLLFSCDNPSDASGNKTPKTEEPQKVGIVLPSSAIYRWTNDAARFEYTVKGLGHIPVIRYAKDSYPVTAADEVAVLQAIEDDGVKVLLYCITNGNDQTVLDALAAIKAAGIRIVALERVLQGASCDYYVGFDSFDIGVAQGSFLADKAAGKGSGIPLYLYAGDQGDYNAFLFFKGAWSVLRPKIADGTFTVKNSTEAVLLKDTVSPGDSELRTIFAQTSIDDWTDANAQTKFTGDIGAEKQAAPFILAPNDSTARGIMKACADQTPAITGFTITGQDCEKGSVQSIIDGKQGMSIFKDTRVLASVAAQTCVDLLDGAGPQTSSTVSNGTVSVPYVKCAFSTIITSNIRTELIDSGYYNVSDFTGTY